MAVIPREPTWFMCTLDEIQRMPDGTFHRLGDDLLRRLETRYRRLRTHGVNDRGESIKGKPDSYVGDTAATASLAVCYTVQRDGWWNKVVKDVRETVAACPLATEVFAVIPHNADRHGPKRKSIDWHSAAQAAAGKATFRLIDGREISRLLDTDYQDLRYEHLGIPYSRLSGANILAGCRVASLATIDSIKASGRFDPGRYSPRRADQELYRLWQSAFWHGNNVDRRVAPVRLIALVNDSGVGKTSLVCEFTRTLGMVLPVLLLQARDLMFGTEDSVVASVLHAIQGFLDPDVRLSEEAALSKLLDGSVPLTVVIDGLDEAHNSEGVQRSINFWLRSRLSQVSILILTSRREFWRTCVDASWERWMPTPNTDDRSPAKAADTSQVEKNDSTEGIRLPDRFSEDELELAWLRAGRPRAELFTLPAEAREELRHPFTLRVYLDLLMRDGYPPPTVTRAELLERWLNHRLDAESLPNERITRSHFQQALRMVASRIAEANSASISIDGLEGVPRFDSSKPPGPVLQKLIDASILETLPGQADHVRFTVEAVQDFYRAEADVESIKNDPKQAAEYFARHTFTSTYPRLARIGYRLVGEEIRHEFILRLLEVDARKAAIVLRASPASYTADTRARLTDAIGLQITKRHRVRAAMSIALLGELNCPEAIETLVKRLFPPADPHRYLKSLGARAFTKLSYGPAADFVYQWEWFGVSQGNDTHYRMDLLGTIRVATPQFREALSDQAVQRLSNATGTKEHAKAVAVLAYLGDDRLVNHLANRLVENKLLAYYENLALIALGSDSAGSLFARSILAVGERLNSLPEDPANHDARIELMDLVHFPLYEVRYLLSSAFHPHLQRLIEDSNPDVLWIAIDLAKRAHATSLLYPVVVALAKRRGSWDLDRHDERSSINPELWMQWWQQSAETSLRRNLLGLLPRYPNAETEEVLIGCLDSPDLRGLAIRRLGEYGAIRSAFRLREILAEEIAGDDRWEKSEAANALGDLRDSASVR